MAKISEAKNNYKQLRAAISQYHKNKSVKLYLQQFCSEHDLAFMTGYEILDISYHDGSSISVHHCLLDGSLGQYVSRYDILANTRTRKQTANWISIDGYDLADILTAAVTW